MGVFAQGYALVIGVAQYPSFSPLPQAVVNDARDVALLLRSPEHGGYAEDHVRLRVDAGATAAQIREDLRWLARSATAGSTVLIYFSGHGLRRVRPAATQGYLLTYDSTPVAPDQTAISDAELTALVHAIGAGRLLICLDCCHAGGLLAFKGAADEEAATKAGLSDETYAALGRGSGRVLIAASRADQLSWVLPGMRNSVFTHLLLMALRGKARARDEALVRVLDLFDYISRELDRWQLPQPQQPVCKLEIEQNFPLTFAAGAGPARVASGQMLEAKARIGAFDTLLCYNSLDREAVRALARQLRAQGVLPWFDEWEQRPGLPWQRAIERQISQIATATVFVGADGVGPWQRLEIEALLREFVRRGCPVIPVVLPDAPGEVDLPLFLRGMQWVDFRYPEPSPLAQLLFGITGEAPARDDVAGGVIP
ncbi:MAG: TIR domain-containing protein [Chloroflexales bacterium]|nr:TIR domain-containing protein [Chloroflexales bacterium]